MKFEDIFYTLEHSINYIEYMITYNELVPDIAKAKQISLTGWIEFAKQTYELKQSFKQKWESDEPSVYLRLLFECKYIYDIDVKHYADEYLRKIKSQNKFNKLFKQQL